MPPLMQEAAKKAARVGIVGGGAAGVIAAKCLQEAGHSVVIFEKSAQLGGVWKYEAATHTDSSMYESLRTNLPTSVMQLSGFSFPAGLQSFVGHSDVLKYIRDYATHYKVTDIVRYNTAVLGFSKQPAELDPAEPVWSVDLKSTETGSYSERFDKLVICNGHFAVPMYASIPGVEYFKGQQLHSHDYRTPTPFNDKTVLLLGYGPSGQDISLELVRSGAKQVTVTFKEFGERPTDPNDRRILKPAIDHIRQDGCFVFSDGSVQDAPDVLMYCTGYRYTASELVPHGILHPTLDGSVTSKLDQDQRQQLARAVENGSVIAPLYRQLFAIEEPDLVFIGLPFKNLPFLCFELQAKWAAQVFSGEKRLPSKENMYEAFIHELQTLPFPIRKLHQLGLERQRVYFEELASYSSTKCDPAAQAMYEDAGYLRTNFPLGYREAEYTHEDGRWVRRIQIKGGIGQPAQELVRVFE